MLDKEYNIEFLNKMIEPIDFEIKSMEKEMETITEKVFRKKSTNLSFFHFLIKNNEILKKETETLNNLKEEIKKLEDKREAKSYEHGKLAAKLEDFMEIKTRKTQELEKIKNMNTLIETESIIKREEIKPKGMSFTDLKKRLHFKEKEIIELNKMEDADQKYQNMIIEHLNHYPLRHMPTPKNGEKCLIF